MRIKLKDRIIDNVLETFVPVLSGLSIFVIKLSFKVTVSN